MTTKYLIVFGVFLSAFASAGPSATADADAQAWLRGDQFAPLDAYYSNLQAGFRGGRVSAEELRNAFRAFYPTDHSLAAHYDAWVKQYPKSYVARLARAIYYRKMGFEERGGKVYAETSQSQIDKMDDAMARAIKDLGASIEMDPKPFLSYFNMIDVSSAYGGPEYSKKAYEHAIRLAPEFVGTRQKYMLSLEERWGGSLEQMKSYLADCRREKLPVTQLNLLESMVVAEEAKSLEDRGNLTGAETAYRRAIELGGADCDACLHLSVARILAGQQKVGEALPFLDHYIEKTPERVDILVWRAQLRMGLRMWAEAVQDLTKAANAGDSEAENVLGTLYVNGILGVLPRDLPKALVLLRQSVAQGNRMATANLKLAESVQARTAGNNPAGINLSGPANAPIADQPSR